MSSALKLVLMAAAPVPATYIGNTAVNPATDPLAIGFGSGAQNDLAIITVCQSSGTVPTITGGSGTWNSTSVTQSGEKTWLLWKRLVTADLSGVTVGNFSGTGGECIVTTTVYRGVYGVLVAGSAGSTTGTNTVTGFTPNARSVGVVSIFAMDNNEGVPANTEPSGFALRYKGTGSNPGPTGLYSMGVADKLSGYAGANIAWTCQVNPNRQIVLELIG